MRKWEGKSFCSVGKLSFEKSLRGQALASTITYSFPKLSSLCSFFYLVVFTSASKSYLVNMPYVPCFSSSFSHGFMSHCDTNTANKRALSSSKSVYEMHKIYTRPAGSSVVTRNAERYGRRSLVRWIISKAPIVSCPECWHGYQWQIKWE